MRREELSMKESSWTETELVAGNGLLHRRMFLAGGAVAMGALVDQAGAAPRSVGVVTGGAGRAVHDDMPVVREGAGLILHEVVPVVALVAHRVGLG